MTEDILERAKAADIDLMASTDWGQLRNLFRELIAEIERLRSENKIISDRAAHHEKQDAAEIELLAARIKELEAEVEAKNKQIKELQDIIDKPPEEADWVADYHLLQSALDGPIIDAARKWHAAYRKAQNSNLMRAKEVERLRAAVGVWEKANSDLIAGLKAGAKEVIAKDARIKRLEASLENAEALVRKNASAMNGYLARIKELQAEIERIDAAFLEATKEIVYATHEGRDAPEGEDVYAEKVAREALEQLRAEGKIGGVKTEYGGQHHCGTQIIRNDAGEWHCPKCNPLLTAEQREALEHVIEYVQETQMPISNLNEFDMQELRSLLTGSKPAWEVTEERIAAMKDACNFLVHAEIRNKGVNPGSVDRAKNAGDVLRAMLVEGKRDA